MMKPSQLIPIIRRLEAMQEDETNDVQVRRFEKDGKERCMVKYSHHSQMYELIDRATEETYKFDNIDYIAVEILELVQPARSGNK